MLAGLTNQDSSFFKITSNKVKERVFNEDIISLTYTEELGKFNTGTLQILDEKNYYSKVLRIGADLEVSFGYASPDFSVNAALLQQKNPTQIFGDKVRNGVKGIVVNPSGSSGSNGVVTFNCNFYGREYLSKKQYKVHKGITKGLLVSQLLTEIGCKNIVVNFTRQFELLSENTQIFQRETNYRLLLRFAYEWRAMFRISYDGLGNLSGVFISSQYIGSINLPFVLSGAIGGNSVFLEYQEGVSNVIEYSWKNHQGQSGSGDNVRIIYGADGRPTFMRYITKGDTVKAYVLKPERIAKKLRESDNFADRFEKLKAWISVEDFESVEWAFDEVELSTAPQGLGYSMSAKMLGNPLISSPLKIKFGEGFPVWFTPSSPVHLVNYYARKVTHIIDRTGYKIDLDIVDGFTLTGGSLI